MVWIFAAVVLILAVLNEGFRKIVFWVGGGVFAFLLLGAIMSGVFAHLN